MAGTRAPREPTERLARRAHDGFPVVLGMAVTVVAPAQEFPLDLSTRRGQASTVVAREAAAPVSICEQQKVTPSLPASRRHLLHCHFCCKSFDRPSLLKRHLRTHTGERPHACSVCGKAFSTSSSLNTHSRIHSGEKPHECQYCGKKFTASSNLYYHRMTHSKEKPHKCVSCPKSFPTPGDLRAHSYMHTGEWPYRCNACGRGFCKQASFRHHLELHSV